MRTLTGAGYVPVVCSLASSPSGEVLNVNADTIAEQISRELGADKLFLMTDRDGLMRDPEDPASLLSYCAAAAIEGLIAEGVIAGGMKPKVQAALRALANGVSRVHIISAFKPSALLLEVFTNEGCGTLVVHDKKEIEQ